MVATLYLEYIIGGNWCYFFWVIWLWYLDLVPGTDGNGNIVSMLVGMENVSNGGFNCFSLDVSLTKPIDEGRITEGLTFDNELRIILLYVFHPLSITSTSLGYFMMLLLH